MTGSAAKGPESTKLQVAPDLDQRLARYREIQMPFHSAGLTTSEKELVEKLVDASRYLEEIFWRQSDPEALMLYESLAASKNPQDMKLRRYLWINASRFDLIDDNKPFVGTAPMPPGRGFYPSGLTREKIEQYVKDHPEKKAEIYSGTTVVRWHGDQLQGIPYHIAYRSFLEPAAKDLRDAAKLTTDPDFAKFLHLRADALLSDDYFPSDLAWLDLKNPKFDIIFAPYETYLDDLLGVKTSYGAAVLIRNEDGEQEAGYVPEVCAGHSGCAAAGGRRPAIQARPAEPRWKSWTRLIAPATCATAIRRWPTICRTIRASTSKRAARKSSSRISWTRASNYVDPADGALRNAAGTGGEGVRRGLSCCARSCMKFRTGWVPRSREPRLARWIFAKPLVRPISGLEEAKADVVGMYGMKWLVDHGALPKDKLEEYYASYVAGIFRTVRFGTGEAHGQAQMMEFNYLSERGGYQA